MFGFLKKFFGSQQTRLLSKYHKIVEEVNAWEEKFQSLTDEELIAKTQEFKQRYKNQETLDDILPEAYGVVKNACRRFVGKEMHIFGYDQKWDMIPYDVQVLGAISMHHGAIAEMHTGEGKTLTALLPLYLHALTQKPVHLVTTNDYLAQRDNEWVGDILRFLGITTGSLTNNTPIQERKATYNKDVVYGTASEFGFDYLRDNSSATTYEEQVQRGYHFAIIDEVDSVLIDEARTPLIISGPVPESSHLFHEIKSGVFHLIKQQKELCNQFATQAKKSIDSIKFSEETNIDDLNKVDKESLREACKKLWLVSKGTPTHNVLRRLKEHPDIRSAIDEWDLFYSSDQNKEDRQDELSVLFMIVDEKISEFELTDKGIQGWANLAPENSSEDFILHDLSEKYIEIDNTTDIEEEERLNRKTLAQQEEQKNKERMHNLRQLLRAHLMMEKDVDYIIQENKIVIIDENTGRPQPGRRFSDGLHQAIEAKENVDIQRETQTFATITLQNYFRMYTSLAGMTGTAGTEASEFKEIYNLDVLEIPTNKDRQRLDQNDEVYMSEREKYKALLKEIDFLHNKNNPILIGTESVEVSEKLSRILKQNKIPHDILNAKNHTQEAEVISKAGSKGAITIATNMAGRGTDIKLEQGVADIGGLHVIGTTRHHSRRIDRQLRGRCARQGDPGQSKFFISFDDPLMRLFGSPRWTSMLKKLRPPEGEPISASILNKSIETAQKRVEQRNYMIRKRTLEYDNVLNKQRQEIYTFRNDVLQSSNILDVCQDLINAVCEEIIDKNLNQNTYEEQSKFSELINSLTLIFPVSFQEDFFENLQDNTETLIEKTYQKILDTFLEKISFEQSKISPANEVESPDVLIRKHVRSLIIQRIDKLWQEHLLAMDELKNDVQMHTVGQKDPLMEFKHEAFKTFYEMTNSLREEILKSLFKFEVVSIDEEHLKQVIAQLRMQGPTSFNTEGSLPEPSPKQIEKISPQITEAKTKRNDICPCGSGKKYKKCCGAVLHSES
jgi:preprotein translocase subunit SecA